MSQTENGSQNESETNQPLRSSFAFVNEGEDLDLDNGEGQVFDVAVNEAIQETEIIPINNQKEPEQPTDPQTPVNEETPTEETLENETEAAAPVPDADPKEQETVTPPVIEEEEPKSTPSVEKVVVPPTKIEPQETIEEENLEISFIVKTPAGKKYNLKLDPETSIDEVKETLAKMENQDLEAKEIKLILRGKPLSNGAKTIKQVGIMKDMKVYMIKQLYGASNGNNKVGPSIQRSTESQRGFITITIPDGARPGNRLIIHPPGRQRMVVYVPRGMGPGDALRVQLPTPGGQPGNNNQQTARNPGVDPTQALQNNNMSYNTVLKAVCPQDGTPGQEVRINVPNVGVLKVAIPATARPGQPFYFRIPPL